MYLCSSPPVCANARAQVCKCTAMQACGVRTMHLPWQSIAFMTFAMHQRCMVRVSCVRFWAPMVCHFMRGQVHGARCTCHADLTRPRACIGSLQLWDVDRGECLETIAGHTKRVQCVRCPFRCLPWSRVHVRACGHRQAGGQASRHTGNEVRAHLGVRVEVRASSEGMAAFPGF